MAKVTVKVTGGSLKEMEADTIADLKSQLSLTKHTATVNGESVDDDYELEDYEFIAFTESVEGGC